MTEWWYSLTPDAKVLWTVTLLASLIFIIQTIMTFIGAAADTDFDINSDFDAPGDDAAVHSGTGMNLLTFRNLVNFLLGFGWTAILLEGAIPSTPLRMLVATVVGVALVVMVMLLFKWITGMQQSGTIDIYKSAVDCQGSVYLTIPEKRGGEGKVQITINGAVREYAAMTDGPALKTGTRIRVVDVVSATTLLVEEIGAIII